MKTRKLNHTHTVRATEPKNCEVRKRISTLTYAQMNWTRNIYGRWTNHNDTKNEKDQQTREREKQ